MQLLDRIPAELGPQGMQHRILADGAQRMQLTIAFRPTGPNGCRILADGAQRMQLTREGLQPTRGNGQELGQEREV